VANIRHLNLDGTPNVGSGHHLIRGNEYKTALDEDGNHLSTGVQRGVPWIAITPVVNAIRVLERLVPDGALLFDATAHNVSEQRSPAAGELTRLRSDVSNCQDLWMKIF
jgi:hypothetical protein